MLSGNQPKSWVLTEFNGFLIPVLSARFKLPRKCIRLWIYIVRSIQFQKGLWSTFTYATPSRYRALCCGPSISRDAPAFLVMSDKETADPDMVACTTLSVARSDLAICVMDPWTAQRASNSRWCQSLCTTHAVTRQFLKLFLFTADQSDSFAIVVDENKQILVGCENCEWVSPVLQEL